MLVLPNSQKKASLLKTKKRWSINWHCSKMLKVIIALNLPASLSLLLLAFAALIWLRFRWMRFACRFDEKFPLFVFVCVLSVCFDLFCDENFGDLFWGWFCLEFGTDRCGFRWLSFSSSLARRLSTSTRRIKKKREETSKYHERFQKHQKSEKFLKILKKRCPGFLSLLCRSVSGKQQVGDTESNICSFSWTWPSRERICFNSRQLGTEATEMKKILQASDARSCPHLSQIVSFWVDWCLVYSIKDKLWRNQGAWLPELFPWNGTLKTSSTLRKISFSVLYWSLNGKGVLYCLFALAWSCLIVIRQKWDHAIRLKQEKA